MLLLVLGENFLVLFVGWEGVGLCSYLLIGFWYKNRFAADAGKKAFFVNRIGDVAFILGVLLAFTQFGSVNFKELNGLVAGLRPEETFGVVSAIALLLFIGATGKSAQIPLYVWLPDAMEGPTPVSALIHAATMVTAGVYLIGRNAVIFAHAPEVLTIVAVIGTATALWAGAYRHGAERHQARAGVLDRVAARLHVHGDGRRRLRGRDLSSVDPCLLQGAAVPGIGAR
jgi:NADH-quinone oxidoreductase subunit L